MNNISYEDCALVTAVILGVYAVLPLVVFLFSSAVAFVTDSEHRGPYFGHFGKTYRNAGEVVFSGLFGVTGAALVGVVWPLAIVAATCVGLLYTVRFLLRCGKSISHLAKVAHDHSGEGGAPKPTYVNKPKFTGDYK